MVYGAFSAATISGMWSRLPPPNLAVLALVNGVLLAATLAGTAFATRRLGLSRQDEIAVVLCGSKKSLVTGISMANALFAGASLGARGAAADDLPPDAADGLHGLGAALCRGGATAVAHPCRARAGPLMLVRLR
jgi:hypothetical protein